MKKLLSRMWRETDGVLSFEWTMLTSLLTVGAVAGITAVRDAINDEMADVTQAMTTLDQSYVIQPPLAVQVHTVGGGYGSAGTYRVQEFNGGSSTGNSSPIGSFGLSTAAGSAFQDVPSRVTRARLPAPTVQSEDRGIDSADTSDKGSEAP
ncbi:MAG: hypothetical protein U0894_16235 [Pirellulales bacterium]